MRFPSLPATPNATTHTQHLIPYTNFLARPHVCLQFLNRPKCYDTVHHLIPEINKTCEFTCVLSVSLLPRPLLHTYNILLPKQVSVRVLICAFYIIFTLNAVEHVQHSIIETQKKTEPL
jgi:hypothetical protein